MSTPRWQLVQDRFHEALELPPEKRAQLLADITDRNLRAEIASLLRASDTAPAMFLEEPAQSSAAAADDCLAAGVRIGAWRVVRLIGRGGMGEVYEVERADGAFEQRAALKLVRREAADLLDRFDAERRILARLEHPGIARLLDGGMTDDGRPYAVMEYVDGRSITDDCTARGAGLAERLGLFLKICDAVSYAHGHLIVHRDIKPANVLVDGEGRVRLLDFGIAKPLDGGWRRIDDAEAATAMLMTPDYAAPEQLRGEPVTTATDVYALGVLLFELLAGRKPWMHEGRPLAQLAMTVLDRPAPRASEAAAASDDPPVAARRLRGDLDAIIAKCLRSEPQHRYMTVDALKVDVERSLRGDPVLARGNARLYVLGRVVRRYRWAMASVAAIVASLAIGLVGVRWQAERAALERDIARRAAAREEAVRYQLIGLFREAVDQPGAESVTARAMLDRSAQRVIDEYGDDPELASKLVESLADLYGALGDTEAQAPLLERFLALADDRADPAAVAVARHKLAGLELRRGNLPRAEPLLAAAEAFWADASDRYREQRLEAALIRGQLERARGRPDAAIATFENAIRERIALSGRDHRETALLYNSLAITLAAVNRYEDALAAYREALAIYERLGRSEDVEGLVMLANTGLLAFRTGRLAEAEQLLKTAADKQRVLSGPSAAVAAAMGNYGAVLAARAEFAAAVPALREAAAMAEEHAGPGSPVAVQNRLFLGEALIDAGDGGTARPMLEETLRVALERFGTASSMTLRLRLALARLAFLSGDAAGAAAELPAIVAGLRGTGPPGESSLALALALHADVLAAAGQPREAVEALEEVVRLRERLLWSGSADLAAARARLDAVRASAGL